VVRRTLPLLLALAPLASCAGVYLQSDFAADLEPAVFAREVLPDHEPMYLALSGEAVEVLPSALLERFRDTLAMSLAERGVVLTSAREDARSVLTLGLSSEARERTRWDHHYVPSLVRRCPDGGTIVVRRGWHYAQPYREVRTWLTFSGALRLEDAAAPVWTGVASFSDRQTTGAVEAAARRLAEMLFDGEEHPLEYESLRL